MHSGPTSEKQDPQECSAACPSKGASECEAPKRAEVLKGTTTRNLFLRRGLRCGPYHALSLSCMMLSKWAWCCALERSGEASTERDLRRVSAKAVRHMWQKEIVEILEG